MHRHWRRISSWIEELWGYDVFIAHRRADGQAYARALYAKLSRAGIACFLDSKVYVAGDSLRVATKRHASKATLLVVVGSPSILEDRQTDWVEAEIDAYLGANRESSKVVVIDFGGVLADSPDHPVARKLEHFIRLEQDSSALEKAPHAEVLDAIPQQLAGRRRDRSRLRLFQGIAAALTLLAIGAAAAAIVAVGQSREANLQRDAAVANESRALAALAEVELASGRLVDVVKLGMAAWPRTAQDHRPQLERSITAISRALGSARFPSRTFPFNSTVEDVTFTQGGRVVARDVYGKLTLYDLDTGSQAGEPMFHNRASGMLAEEDKLLSWGGGVMTLWNLNSGEKIGVIRYGKEYSGGALFTRTGQILSWSEDTARLWDADTGAQIGQSMEHTSFIVSGAMPTLDGRILTWSTDQTLSLWSSETGDHLGPTMRHDDHIEGALLTGDANILAWSSDGIMRLWN